MRTRLLGSVAMLSLAAISACSDSSQDATATSVTAETPTTESPTTETPTTEDGATTALPMTSEMAVAQPIERGQQFEVAFSGGLRDMRGGYLFVHDAEGEPVALLWDDYLTEDPLGYELDPSNWTMLDYGVTSETSSFVFPSELPAGDYLLCTANSANGGCVAVTAA